jgi:tRNA threonylcarbamoyladenosine biosynthesis protein TsaE
MFGKKYAESLKTGDIVALYGELGSGKTQIVKGICSAFGVNDIVNSPTFIIVNEYASAVMNCIYHFDFYRLKNTEEVLNTGFEEYLNHNGLILIEWPELIEDILPEKTKKIYIKHVENKTDKREITTSPVDVL